MNYATLLGESPLNIPPNRIFLDHFWGKVTATFLQIAK